MVFLMSKPTDRARKRIYSKDSEENHAKALRLNNVHHVLFKVKKGVGFVIFYAT